MTEKLPKVAHAKSIKVEVEPGKKYLWCSCGLSQNQPFCDGAHKGTGFLPFLYETSEAKVVSFCGCKYSKEGPLCDGTHKALANIT